ncbi:MAG: hypothetical protein IT558_03245 [Alphaproteobacteria bacterium]|nr:hypothetical protein [Alphaproteobacteria bacterium]
MFAFFRKKNPYEAAARKVYAALLEYIRHPAFYREMGVPDSFTGRFDLMLMHIFLVMERFRAEAPDFNQALFDATFFDMDQTLREMGIGDMGVPKRMRRMMKAFNGRMHAYSEGFQKDDLDTVLRRNLYGTITNPDEKFVQEMKIHMKQCSDILANVSLADACEGRPVFPSFGEELRYVPEKAA